MIRELAGRHAGATAYVVGRGPSLLSVGREAFGPGPVIALNHAIAQVRSLDLPNPVYSMQKDGCYTGRTPLAEREPCGGCPREPMVAPLPPEALIVSADESPHCLPDYPARYAFDPVADFGRPRSNMSAPLAVEIARLMGASEVVMVAHDAHLTGDARRVTLDGSIAPDEIGVLPGYRQGAQQAEAIASASGMGIRWLA